MIRRMARLNCDKGSAARCSYLVVCYQFTFDNNAVAGGLNYASDQTQRRISRCGPEELDRVISSHSTRRMIESIALHQVISGGPIAVTVKHGAGNAAAQHPGKRFLIGLRLPLGDHRISFREAADVQTPFVGRATAETLQVWRVGFLDAFFIHKQFDWQ